MIVGSGVDVDAIARFERRVEWRVAPRGTLASVGRAAR
jgi:hypothetical protein